ncbi:unnamed protein product [Diabrotica balteata]|uniref:BRCT domain-containing protein n=1 Tax=Diabrotica balteata TaxID=107213 RepID=A0A9N9TD57_DIABA|nr:unnamed protein product [Diabrotica balteata]
MKPKISNGYLTPQPTKKKDKKENNNARSTDNLNTGLVFNDELFSQLMKDPVKRNLIINLITSEKDKIEAYKKELAKKHPSSPLLKTMKRACESPTALLRRRALEQMKNPQSSDRSENGSNNSRPTSRQSVASSVPSPVSYDKILDGVIAFVEVKTGTKDRSDAVKAHLQSMGAVIREKITKDVTHVIFKDGSFTTYQKANLLKVHLVSVLWLEACKSSCMKVSEKNYPAIGTEAYDHNVSALCSQMQKDYEDIIHEEFQRSIHAGTPLPSAKTLIDRRRTMVMTPAGKEVHSFTRRSLQAGPSRISLTPDEDITDDESDLGPLIDGDIVDRSSDLFEDCLKDTPVKYDEVLSKTSNNNEDMELTDLKKSPLHLQCKSPDSSPEVYTLQTQQIIKSVSKTSRNEEVNDDDIYRRRTALMNNLDDDNIATPGRINDRKSRVRTPRSCRIFNKGDELTPEESKTLTPRSLHIFSKNISHGTPDIAKSNKGKGSALDLITETNSSVAQTFSKPTEKSSSTNMSSLRISDSKNDSSTSKKSFESCKTSFSPLQTNVNNILKTLQNSSLMSDKLGELENNTSNYKDKDPFYDKEKAEEIQNKNTPSDKAKSISFEHVTLRKKRIQKEKDSIDEEEINKITQDLFHKDEDKAVDEGFNEVKKPRSNRRKTLAATTVVTKDKPENQIEVSSKKIEKSKTPQTHIRNVARTLEKEFETSDEDEDIVHEIENPKETNKLRNTRPTVGGGEVKENIQQTASAQVIDDPNIKKRQKRVVKQNKRQTIGPILKSQETESNERKAKANRRKTLAPSDASKTEKVSANDKSSPAKKVKMSPPDKACTRRKTISSSVVKLKGGNKQILRRTMSSTDVNDIDTTISPDSKPQRRFRKLYSPTALQEICIDDNQDRQEKRQAKKLEDPGVFVKPIIVSQKMKNILDKNNLEIENIINPTQQKVDSKPIKNKKKNDDKPQFNSDDDEQVDLLNELLNKNKIMGPPKDSTKSSVTDNSNTDNKKINVNDRRLSTRIKLKEQSQKISKTPRTQQKRDLTLKSTPLTSVRSRRSTHEFQSLTQSAKKKLKIDKPVQPSIVCTKMHAQDVQVFMQIVKKLGRFDVEDEVSSKTTHLVAGEPKRTINMLRAITRGCWVLKKEWLFKSLESGKWLPEEDFEETNFSAAVEKNRLQRQAFGPTYTMDIFQNCGPIYVAKGSIPRCSDIRELISLCKGKTTTIPRNASVVVGEYAKNDGGVCVSEAWILDSISQNKKLPFKKYLIPSNRKSGAV